MPKKRGAVSGSPFVTQATTKLEAPPQVEQDIHPLSSLARNLFSLPALIEIKLRARRRVGARRYVRRIVPQEVQPDARPRRDEIIDIELAQQDAVAVHAGVIKAGVKCGPSTSAKGVRPAVA